MSFVEVLPVEPVIAMTQRRRRRAREPTRRRGTGAPAGALVRQHGPATSAGRDRARHARAPRGPPRRRRRGPRRRGHRRRCARRGDPTKRSPGRTSPEVDRRPRPGQRGGIAEEIGARGLATARRAQRSRSTSQPLEPPPCRARAACRELFAGDGDVVEGHLAAAGELLSALVALARRSRGPPGRAASMALSIARRRSATCARRPRRAVAGSRRGSAR